MSFLSELINTGVDQDLEPFETVKTRLVNFFSLIGAVLSIIFAVMNYAVGAYIQASLILTALIVLAVPPIYLNQLKKRNAARLYLVCIGLVFIDFITFRAVLNFQNRHNELFLIGFSSIILVLLNNPFRFILYSLTAISTLIMITVRQVNAGLTIGSDTYMAYLNAIVGYLFIYLFLSLFKKEQEKSIAMLDLYSKKLEKQGDEIAKQRDDVFANRKLIRDTIDNLPVYISLIDMEGKYLLANQLYCETFNIPLHKIEGENYTNVLPPELLTTHSKLIDRGLKGESPEFNEYTTFPDGSSMYSMGRYVPMYDDHNRQFALAVYVVDVTQLKNTESQLRTLNQTKSRLLSIISHDIRGPLSSLKGLIAISEQITESEFRKFVENVDKQLTTVNFNLDNVLNWAKTQMQGFKVKLHLANVTEILMNSLKLFEPQLNEKGIKLTLDADKKATAFVDNNCLYLVFRNLISNAIKFSFPKSEITIRSIEKDDNLFIEIMDQGQGIPPEKIDELDKGAQSVESEVGTIGESGTGLGLSLSLEMAKMMGGRLYLAPNPSGGTIARIKLIKKKEKAMQD